MSINYIALFDFLQVESEDNILRDGTMIDLCGATLIWRSSSGLQASPVSSSMIIILNVFSRNLPYLYKYSLYNV